MANAAASGASANGGNRMNTLIDRWLEGHKESTKLDDALDMSSLKDAADDLFGQTKQKKLPGILATATNPSGKASNTAVADGEAVLKILEQCMAFLLSETKKISEERKTFQKHIDWMLQNGDLTKSLNVQDAIEKKIEEEFQSHRLWAANQFVILRSSEQPGSVSRPHADPSRNANLRLASLKGSSLSMPRQESAGNDPDEPDKLQSFQSFAPRIQEMSSRGNERGPCKHLHDLRSSVKEAQRVHAELNEKQRLTERVMASLKMDTERISSIFEKPDNVMTRLVDSYSFQVCTSLVILTNALWIGVQTEYLIKGEVGGGTAAPDWHKNVNRAFLGFFGVELILSLYGYRLYFFCGPDAQWNLYDVFVVVMGILEEVNDHFMNLSILRCLRICRVVRLVKIIRTLRAFCRFRHLICTMILCIPMLVWTCIFLSLLIYTFAIIFLQSIDTLVDKDDALLLADLNASYGSVFKAMYSLLQAISSGRPWVELVEPLQRVSWIFIPLFALYLVLVLFGVLNVLTGVFVGECGDLKRRDRDLTIHREMEDAEAFNRELRKLFWEEKLCLDGYISREVLEDERCAHVIMFLQSHGLDSKDSHELFHLLDPDDRGSLSLDDFIHGCLRLKSVPKGMDIMFLFEQIKFNGFKITENRDQINNMHRHMDIMRDSVKAMRGDLAETISALYARSTQV